MILIFTENIQLFCISTSCIICPEVWGNAAGGVKSNNQKQFFPFKFLLISHSFLKN